MSKFMEIWLINNEGLTFAHWQLSANDTLPSNVFSGFFRALQSMAADSIDAINMRDSKILIVPVPKPIPFFVVGRAKVKEKDANMRKALFKVRDQFVQQFGEKLPKWCGDVGMFDQFEKSLEKYEI